MNDTDMLHMVSLEKRLTEKELELSRAKALLTQIRAYFETTVGWIDLFEEDYKEFFNSFQGGTDNDRCNM